jgi:hypothetical protein
MKRSEWIQLASGLGALAVLCGAGASAAQDAPAPSSEAPPPAAAASAAQPELIGPSVDPEGDPDAPRALVPPQRETDVLQPSVAGESAGSGPSIELPPELPPAVPLDPNLALVQLGSSAQGEDSIVRGLAPERMRQSNTVIGGYGQFNLNALRIGPAGNEYDVTANVRRLVLFVAHPITNAIRVYSEFEWENAIACSSCDGSVEVEQAFLEWNLIGRALSLRAGLLLVPMGIVNQWHEPPVFHGVDRPAVDTFIIPTTWRELGLGFAGQLSETWRYELYFTTTLDPLRLDSSGLGAALEQGSLAKANAFAVTGRMELEPLLGIVAGASFFASDLGGNGDYFGRRGNARDLSLPLLGYALDARVRRLGMEARAVWSQFYMPNAGDLLGAFRDDGSPLFPNVDATGPIPELVEGGYFEVAYNTLFWLRTGQELLAFARFETYDTQAEVPDGYDKQPELDVSEYTFGLTYRPLPQLVWKADLQLRDRRLGLDELQINAGFGYMF